MEKTKDSSGVGFVGLLQVAFIVLKLVGVIHWSWWWVLAPMLAIITIAIIILGLLFVYVTTH